MPVTIRDVAKVANVSPSTVSRVIADNPKISEETKKKVYNAMKKLNYHPNAIARSLANKSTKTLGIILPNTSEDLFMNPFFIQAMRGISVYGQKKGYYIMYSYSNNEEEEVDFISKYINSKWVDGIILLTARQNDRCISYLKEVNHPFVVIGRPENTEEILWVDNDNFKAMYDVVTHLIEKGHRNIAFIGGPHSLNVTKDRFEGYKMALQARGINIDEHMISETDFSEDRGYDAMKKILEQKIPDAVVTTDDLIAFGALKAIKEMDEKKIAVVGFNNTLLAAYQSPTLTSVDIKTERLGYRAAQLLIDKIENKETKVNHYIVETELIERESTQ
ncbi:LacI family DNA-binding transcriptional regulator [Caldisalinibacter kiritimatiensis]|uniref:Maltose operon transcriptional repressor MalR, LacI family n=1 Tax=Caldisalinibacter kiritimatiensis TaxID=1304284 RepID=R1CQ27_9FIRM|nr:LacI family DNA-binding transcriptional regulator [Caldisalinibacter kiritimatiensis]EOD00786.1 Maltose operon transcriptional repressor MalR, LacI family [Caldisalinibacter kiritimatiensis]